MFIILLNISMNVIFREIFLLFKVKCPAGSYCLKASSDPDLCPEGTFSNSTGLTASSECLPCTAGFYCEDKGQTNATGPCEKGKCDSKFLSI